MFALLFSSASLQALPPNPAFPVGNISAQAVDVIGGKKASLAWSIHLPDGANLANHVFYIRQVQRPSSVNWDTIVTQSGAMTGGILLDSSGAEFQLWAIQISPLVSYLLDTTLCSDLVPTASVTIRSQDPYPFLPRTRADQPIHVDVTISGIQNSENTPDALKSVNLIRHAQSYGINGSGANLDRLQASVISQSSINTNGTMVLAYTTNAVPGTNPTKARGEERFSIYPVEDYLLPESVLDSQFIQIWPVADGSIAGITQGQMLGPAFPQITLTLHDLYPDSSTWAQVYLGPHRTGAIGTTLPGSSVILNQTAPENRVINLSGYGSVFDSDGLWTLEILTRTPFGTDRLAHVSFSVQGLGMTLDGWRQAHFGSTDNSGDGADLNDFEHDSIPNLIEFAFGFDPKQNSAGMLPALQKMGNQRVISFTQPSGILGVTWGAEWSPNMLPGTWLPMTDTGITPMHVFSVMETTSPSCFIRLKVTQP